MWAANKIAIANPTPRHTYLTVGRSLTLAVMSTASGWRFSTSCSKSHNSFFGPSRPCVVEGFASSYEANLRQEGTSLLTFFGLSPCLRMCSKTMKKCCRGMWSESSWRPNLRLESITSLITSCMMLTRLLRSITTGSRSESV